VADVDLIPAGYSRVQLVRRRVKQFLIACISVFVVVGILFSALSVATSLERSNVGHLENEIKTATKSNGEVDGYRQQKLLAEKQLTELDQLRGRNRLSLFLRAVDSAYSDSIWLDELHYFRRDPSSSGTATTSPGPARPGIVVMPAQNVPVSGEAPNPQSAGQRVEIIGHATSHTRLAEFIRRLTGQPGIAEVRLLDTGLGNYSNSPVIDFILMVQVDERIGKLR